MEKLVNCNTQTIAELFNSGHSSTVVSAADDVVHSRLRNTADAAQPVNGDITLLT